MAAWGADDGRENPIYNMAGWNLNCAKALSAVVPPTVLAKADEVIH